MKILVLVYSNLPLCFLWTLLIIHLNVYFVHFKICQFRSVWNDSRSLHPQSLELSPQPPTHPPPTPQASPLPEPFPVCLDSFHNVFPSFWFPFVWNAWCVVSEQALAKIWRNGRQPRNSLPHPVISNPLRYYCRAPGSFYSRSALFDLGALTCQVNQWLTHPHPSLNAVRMHPPCLWPTALNVHWLEFLVADQLLFCSPLNSVRLSVSCGWGFSATNLVYGSV